MERIANLDVTRNVPPGTSRLALQIAFGLACTVPAVALRSVVDLISTGAGPFALIYPTVLIATLFGRWQAGVVALVVLLGWVLFVLPPDARLDLTSRGEATRLGLNLFSSVVTLLLAEAFRKAVRAAEAKCVSEIEESRVLRMELEHRTKNNLALVSGLLQLQERRETDPAAKQALAVAAGRVASLAGAYANLPISQSVTEDVPMLPYLSHLVDDVEKAVFDDGVKVRCEVADIRLSRDIAMVIGLYTNEALINCAKHAYRGTQAGTVVVSLTDTDCDWTLQIRDDGQGDTSSDVHFQKPDGSGLGTSLMKALAKQAGARHRIAFQEKGCLVELRASKSGSI